MCGTINKEINMRVSDVCTLCGKPLVGNRYACDVCHKPFCSACESFLSITHVGKMNVGKVCPACLNKDKNLHVIDSNNPRYLGQGD